MDDRWTAAGISETFLREKSPLIQPIRLQRNKKTFGAHLSSLKLTANPPKNGCFGIGAFPIGVFAVSFGVRVFAAKRSVQWVGSSSPFSALPGAPDEVGTLL